MDDTIDETNIRGASSYEAKISWASMALRQLAMKFWWFNDV
jgi:hypothetical protein